jgi:hypothetical protein
MAGGARVWDWRLVGLPGGWGILGGRDDGGFLAQIIRARHTTNAQGPHQTETDHGTDNAPDDCRQVRLSWRHHEILT